MTVWPDPAPAQARNSGSRLAIVLASVGGNLLSLALPLAILQVYDRIIPAGAVETLVVLLAGVAVALVLEALLTAVRAALIGWGAAQHEHQVGRQLFSRLLAANPAAFGAQGAGLHAERFSALSRIKEFRAGQGLALLADLPFAVLFVGLIAVIGGWIAVIPVAVLAVFAALLLGSDLARAKVQRAADDLRMRQLDFVLETLGHIGAIKAAALEAPMARRFERLLANATLAEQGVLRGTVAGQVLQASLGSVSMIAVAAGGSIEVMAGHLTLGELAACTLLANRALQPMQRMLGLWTGFRQQALQRAQVAKGLALHTARPLTAPALHRLTGDLALDKVSVTDARDGFVLLDQISLSVTAGEMVGITGPAGGGKSTLLRVMAGLRRPDAGQVRLDRIYDPYRHSEDSLLGQIAHVASRASVFSGTLMENMTGFAPRQGDRDSVALPVDRDLALHLADRIGLTGLAGRLPDGFNTEVGPGSLYALPQGLAQRIALVRALYRQPRILLFDAANTALDSGGDAMMRQLLLDRRGQCTMVIASQRPSLLAIADRVLVLDNGHLRRADPRPASPPAIGPGPRAGAGRSPA